MYFPTHFCSFLTFEKNVFFFVWVSYLTEIYRFLLFLRKHYGRMDGLTEVSAEKHICCSLSFCVRRSVCPSVPCFFRTENMNVFPVRMIIFDKKNIVYQGFSISIRGCVRRLVGRSIGPSPVFFKQRI